MVQALAVLEAFQIGTRIQREQTYMLKTAADVLAFEV